MLIEFLSNIYPTGYEKEFFKLQQIGITPIVAHPERYKFIQNTNLNLDQPVLFSISIWKNDWIQQRLLYKKIKLKHMKNMKANSIER